MLVRTAAALVVLGGFAAQAQTTALSHSAAEASLQIVDGAVWSGPVTQPGYRPYELKIHYADGVLKVDYPDLDCGGFWEPVQAGEGSVFYYERLTYGHVQCYDNGWIELIRTGPDQMTFNYRFAPSDAVDSWATLHRR